MKLHQISEPPQDWGSALDAAYKHERFITGRINGLVKLGREENDYASESLLQWFVDEQVEEADTSSSVVNKLKLVGGDGNGLLMVDRELGQRTFTLSPDLASLYAQDVAG